MSVNDFNEGVEYQTKVHYAFMRKQGEATDELSKRIIKKLDKLGNIVEFTIDELNAQEMKRVFGVCRSLDIGVLDESDQIKLLSYLKTMTTRRGQNTQQQLNYFFAVKRYLNIGNVSDNMNLSSVAELDISRSELEAFLECVCEFLFLKNGTRDFLNTFKEEIECFGLNDKVINEIVTTIEKTYNFFGIQGIVEHYSLAPIKRENTTETESKPIVIPYFEKPIVIVYSSRSKHGEMRAKMLQICIHERLQELNLECSVEIHPGNKAKSKKLNFEREKANIIYIGEPSMSKPLYDIVKHWEFDNFGMKYITSGLESIITVDKLKKTEYKDFLKFAKEQQLRQKNEIESNLKSQEDTILATAFDKDESIAVNIMAGILGSWLILPSAIIDMTSKADDRTKLKNLQYGVVIDKFVASKIDPILNLNQKGKHI